MVDKLEEERKIASNGWFIAGLVLGLIAWLIALGTHNGDGRTTKAFSGCLLQALIIGAFFGGCSVVIGG